MILLDIPLVTNMVSISLAMLQSDEAIDIDLNLGYINVNNYCSQ